MSRRHDWAHDVRAKAIRAAAYANPGTCCWRCGLTLAQVRERNPGRKVVWHAGHTGDEREPLLAEDSLCNLRDAAATTRAKVATRRVTSGGSGRF